MFLCCGKLRLHDLNSNGLLEIEAGFGGSVTHGDPGLATSEEAFWHQDFLSHWDSMECDTHRYIYIYMI